MFDFSSQGAPDANFETALKARGSNLAKISCESGPAPENERFSYDMTEGLDTIVNNVRSIFQSLFELYFQKIKKSANATQIGHKNFFLTNYC